MARKKRGSEFKPQNRREIPPDATKKASDSDLRPGERPSPLGDRHAAGTPGGGTGYGGLGATNIDDGSPANADLEEAMGTGVEENPPDEQGPPYAGISSGAVGGTPAQGRSSGGNAADGITPGSVHRGDSTIGTNPASGSE